MIPERGIVLPCHIIEAYDGDTLTANVYLPMRVRLLNCYADEIRTKDLEEKQRGYSSRDNLKKIAEGREGLIHIPWSDARRMDDIFTFGRVLANVWVDGQSLAEQQVQSNFATATPK